MKFYIHKFFNINWSPLRIASVILLAGVTIILAITGWKLFN